MKLTSVFADFRFARNYKGFVPQNTLRGKAMACRPRHAIRGGATTSYEPQEQRWERKGSAKASLEAKTRIRCAKEPLRISKPFLLPLPSASVNGLRTTRKKITAPQMNDGQHHYSTPNLSMIASFIASVNIKCF